MNNKLKQKVQRGGALFLVTMMCFTGLVGCGPKKTDTNQDKKPGVVQGESNKKDDKKNTGKVSNKNTGKVNTDKKDDKNTGKTDTDKKDDKNTGKTDTDKKDDKNTSKTDTDKKDDKNTGLLNKGPVKTPDKDAGNNGTKAPDSSKVPDSGKTGSKNGL